MAESYLEYSAMSGLDIQVPEDKTARVSAFT